MTPWPQLPDDVVAWFREVFAQANRRICERLVNLPNIRETSLDDGLIEALIPDSAPTLLPSGAIVRMETHNIGGLRRFGGPDWARPFARRWETADIAVLVFVYRGDALIARKIGLLQSKRLYPANNEVDAEDEADLVYGMNAFLGRDPTQASGALYRDFLFDEDCIYGAIRTGDRQVQTIEELNRSFGKVVYYLLYHPHQIPCSVRYPLRERVRVDQVEVGCRVLDADHVHSALVGMSEGESPTFANLNRTGAASYWSLETWAADMMLTCRVGQQFEKDRDTQVRYFLERRTGPIGAALAVSITLPV